MNEIIKMKAGAYMVPVHIEQVKSRLYLKFNYNKSLLEEVKAMEGAKWHGYDEVNPRKIWSIADSTRNRFQIDYLTGKNPYAWYDRPLVDYRPEPRSCYRCRGAGCSRCKEGKVYHYQHQIDMIQHVLTYRQCILAAEMGCLGPETLIKCERANQTKPIKDWKTLPYLRSYDREGNIIVSKAKRIIKKRMKRIRINGELIVGENHLFLTGNKQLCLAKTLKVGDSLVIERNSGISITSNLSIQNKKPIGSDIGTGMDQYTCKKRFTKQNYLQEILESFINLLKTFNSLENTEVMRLVSTVLNYWTYLKRDLESGLIWSKDSLDILFEDCLMLMDQFPCQKQASPSHSVMLPYPYSTELGCIWTPMYLEGMEHTRYQLLVEEEFNSLETISIQGRLDSWKERLQNSDMLGKVMESQHFIPNSFRNLKACEIEQLEYLPEGDVYDFTILTYGNYFDANGINHQNTGKTLSAIEVLDYLGYNDVLWVGPRSALASVKLEFHQWKARTWPEFYTYEGLKKLISNWPPGKKAPRIVVFDESSRIKSHTAQRSQAARILSEMIREDWGKEGYIVEMSGSPAPKSPVDWYNQCEVACPGYIREGTIEKFKQRLGLIVQKESISGGVYPHLITWRDDESKCATCGKYESDSVHEEDTGHPYTKSINEVAYLYKRMKGLVIVKFKAQCLDLPEKQYRVINIKPNRETLNALKLIEARAPRAITALTLSRELSDGFQYVEEDIGLQTCILCKGSKTIDAGLAPQNLCPFCDCLCQSEFCANCGNYVSPMEVVEDRVSCPRCGGSGESPRYSRKAIQVESPKADVLKDLIEEHEDVGRIVIYAGFSGSVDRCVSIAQSLQWQTIKVDGRGWVGSMGLYSDQDYLEMFQDGGGNIAFVGQPSAAGMGLTLTASPTIVYYSNDFNAESRIQSEDRIHRPGMDLNRGATIIDLIHLPTDQLVLDNLKKKRRLQDMSMGQYKEFMSKYQ